MASAVRMVASCHAAGTASRASRRNTAPRAAASGASPRPASRRFSRARAFVSRERSVRSLQCKPGGLHLGHALQVAVDDRQAILLGQPGDLLVQRREQLVRVRGLARRAGDSHFSHLPLVPAPPDRGDIGVDRDPMRDLVQPASQGLSSADGVPRLDQDQEGGLEGVLCVVRIAQDRPADAQDHGPVPTHQLLEGPGVPTGEEALQELRVGEPRDHSVGE